MSTLSRLLFTKIDNSSLLIFRIFFGILVALECYGAILTGWVRDTMVNPQFTFNFIGFEWLQPLPGYGMYSYFFVMGTLGVGIALGYKYRFSIISFTLLWTGVYLMQKTSYNNHYYLLILISALMCFFPANTGYSIDAKKNPSIKKNYMLGYVKWMVILQLFIVYTYAAVAKIYGDWLDFGVIKILMSNKAEYYVVGDLLQQPWIHKIIGVFGILFDGLVIPALLWKPTRKFAFFASFFFHLFNSIVFQIGIFPYLSLAFTVFFFEPEIIRNLFFKKKSLYLKNGIEVPSFKNVVFILGGIYFIVQLVLPIRHHFIPDDVLWTEEGHRMSWRMMLRSRNGRGLFKVVNKTTGKQIFIKEADYLNKSQAQKVFCYPDFTWQFANYLKKEFSKNGAEVSVYLINSTVSINGRPYLLFINSNVDLGNTPWKPLQHHEWILPSKLVETKP